MALKTSYRIRISSQLSLLNILPKQTTFDLSIDADPAVVVDNFVAIQKLAIKFGQNQVHNNEDIAVIVVVVDALVLVVLVLVHVVAVDPRNLPLLLIVSSR